SSSLYNEIFRSYDGDFRCVYKVLASLQVKSCRIMPDVPSFYRQFDLFNNAGNLGLCRDLSKWKLLVSWWLLEKSYEIHGKYEQIRLSKIL
ncbi:hypothetical protein, partial [Nitrosomonas supralitoralis]|uniref:hypothetical protein n=1 Tax=Nitrosomonas supralitoralis TaxID=2116706 RepID=UPI001A90AB97